MTASNALHAFERGRVWTGTALSSYWGMPAWLARDASDEYRRRLQAARRHWAPLARCLSDDATGFGLDRAEIMTSIYEREPLRGLERLERSETASSNIVKHRSVSTLLQGLCAASALSARRNDQRLRTVVEESASHLEGPHMRPFVHICNAALAVDETNLERAAGELRTAADLFDTASMAMHAAATRRRLGQMLGGEGGKAHAAAAEAFMLAQRVLNLESLTEMLCPGAQAGTTA